MNKKSITLLILAILAMVFALRIVSQHSESTTLGAGADAGKRPVGKESPAPLSSGSPRPQDRSIAALAMPTANEIVETSPTFMDAIARAKLQFGGSDSRVADLQNMAEVVCSAEPDPTNATNPAHTDKSRSWAVARVVSLCEGFRSEVNKAPMGESPSQMLAQTLKRDGKTAAVLEANRTIASAEDFDSLYTAGQVLLETGAMPLDQILPGHEARYGAADLMPAWAAAVQLAGCAGRGGCGPDSLPTASFCAAMGCIQGVTYEQALRQELPESQYRAIIAFQQWLLSQRLKSNNS